MLETSIFAQHITHVRREPQPHIERRGAPFSALATLPRGPISETLMQWMDALCLAPLQKMRRGERPPEIKNICLKGIGEPNDPLSAHG
jgi:hypothetical protein